MQAAFREHHGLQCGFCTPGMIMTAVDIVNRKGSQPRRATIREELEGNICRCTGYHNIVKAVEAGAPRWARREARWRRSDAGCRQAGLGRPVIPGAPSRRQVLAQLIRQRLSQPLRRHPHRKGGDVQEGTHDIDRDRRARAPQGGSCGSSPARASTPTTSTAPASPTPISCARRTRTPRIKRIDAAAALATPGVLAVLTGDDLAADKVGGLICGWMIHSKDGSPMKAGPHPALAQGKVRYVGDHVAVVIAEDYATAPRRGREGRRRLRRAAGRRRHGARP